MAALTPLLDALYQPLSSCIFIDFNYRNICVREKLTDDQTNDGYSEEYGQVDQRAYCKQKSSRVIMFTQ